MSLPSVTAQPRTNRNDFSYPCPSVFIRGGIIPWLRLNSDGFFLRLDSCTRLGQQLHCSRDHGGDCFQSVSFQTIVNIDKRLPPRFVAFTPKNQGRSSLARLSIRFSN